MGQLESKITVLRALSVVVARRAIRFFVIATSIIFTLCLIGIGLLVYFFGSWWWLLLVLYLLLLVVAMGIYIVTRFIIWRMYPHRLTREQTKHLQEFSDKIIRLLETRGLGWWWFTAVCLGDVLLYRELRMLKSLLSDAVSLKSAYLELEEELA